MRATRLAFSLIVVWPSSAAAVGPRGPLSATERKRLATARCAKCRVAKAENITADTTHAWRYERRAAPQ